MYIYLPHGDIWMNCGITPPSEDLKIWVQDIIDHKVKVKFSTETLGSGDDSDLSDEDVDFDSSGKGKKKKHRTIKDVIEIVLAWKRFKKGVKNKKGELIKFTP